MYKVLVICGGGIFGYIPAKLIAGTECQDKGYQIADAFGGTSIGGILTLMYNFGYKPEEVRTNFIKLSKKAFYRSFWSKLNPWGPKFNGIGLEDALDRLFGSAKLEELARPAIVPTINFQHNKPKIYDNIIMDSDSDISLKDLARMTSAAPTYFPPKDGHIDGGLIANNPVIETVTAIKSKLNIPFDNMEVLAIGTGKLPNINRNMKTVAKWSAIKWLSPMLNYLTKANEMGSDFIAKQLGLKSYTLFNPVELDPSWDMDQPELIDQLDKLVEPWQSQFNDVFKKFRAH